MDYKEILELIGIFLLSAVKFGWVGVPAAVFGAKYDFFMTVTITTGGGFVGIVFFSYLSEWLVKSAKRISGKNQSEKQKQKFTFKNKSIVRVKRVFGLAGIAFLTPPLLSHPVGVFLAIRYFKNKTKVISYMLVSTVCWSIALYFFYRYMYDVVKVWLGA